MSGYNSLNFGFPETGGDIERGKVLELTTVDDEVRVQVASDESSTPVGVALTSGEQAEGLVTVEVNGSVTVKTDEDSIDVGSLVVSDSDGKVKEYSDADHSYNQIVGRTLSRVEDGEVLILLK